MFQLLLQFAFIPTAVPTSSPLAPPVVLFRVPTLLADVRLGSRILPFAVLLVNVSARLVLLVRVPRRGLRFRARPVLGRRPTSIPFATVVSLARAIATMPRPRPPRTPIVSARAAVLFVLVRTGAAAFGARRRLLILR